MRKAAIAFFIAIVALGGLTAYWQLSRSKPAAVQLPSPNGFDYFLKAAQQLPLRGADITNKPVEFVAENQAAYKLIEEGLRAETEIPEQLLAPANMNQNLPATFKSLSYAFLAKGLAAEQSGKVQDAAAAYTDLIRFGQAIEHGPLLMVLVGISFERIGLRELDRIYSKLDAAAQSAVQAEVTALNGARLSWEEAVQRERQFTRRHAQSPVVLIYARFSKSLRTAIDKAHQKYVALEQEFRDFPQGAGR